VGPAAADRGLRSVLTVATLAVAPGAIDDAAPIGVRIVALGFGLFGVFLMFGVAVIVARTFPRSSARGVGLAMDDDGTPVLRIRQSRSRQVSGGIALLLSALRVC
jgi:hypothetical protein